MAQKAKGAKKSITAQRRITLGDKLPVESVHCDSLQRLTLSHSELPKAHPIGLRQTYGECYSFTTATPYAVLVLCNVCTRFGSLFISSFSHYAMASSIALLTVPAYQMEPFGVRSPKPFSLSAIALSVIPSFLCCFIIATTAVAGCVGFLTSLALASPSSHRGLPNTVPRALAAARAAFVLADICSRSNSPKTASNCMVILFAWGLSAAINSTPDSSKPEMK
jgi:Zn-dependent protease